MTAPGPPRFRPPWALLLLALAVSGEEDPNPVHPAAVPLLRDPAKCVAFAEEAGRAILARPPNPDPSVYSGDAGVAILHVGLYRATGKKEWLDAARASLDRAVAAMGDDPGLYTGRAGVGQACLDAYRATGDEAFLAKARACATGLAAPKATDVISGAAGIGIFQLNLQRATGAKEDLAAAAATGEWLATRAIATEGAVCWRVGDDETSRIYTGFSHGAAGIGYFLLKLSQATASARFLDLAERAARFVARSAMPEGTDGWLWNRTVPPIEGEEIRIQWCHGPPGNGLLFAELVRAGKAAYRPALDRCLATTRRLGRTARAGGCQCHGVAGNAELLLEAYVLTKDPALLDEARLWATALLVPKGEGFALEAGYGSSYMLGLAGIGHFFLRLADPQGAPLPLMVGDGSREGGGK
ncbi:MAG TPA: lanthionine synthetase LanC family protein [Planctomycetota bacterium]|nr:lanthionine synthetase LanC family protein [Planctomycetota bacterium]